MKPRYTITEITPPEAEPVTLDELKTFLRISHGSEDDALQTIIKAARLFCENYTGKAFVGRSYKAIFERVADCGILQMPRTPLIAVSSVKMRRADGILDEIESGQYETDLAGGAVLFKNGGLSGPVEIIYTAGFGNPEDVPESIRQAVLMKATQLYEDRGDVRVTAPFDMIASLLRPYKKIGIV